MDGSRFKDLLGYTKGPECLGHEEFQAIPSQYYEKYPKYPKYSKLGAISSSCSFGVVNCVVQLWQLKSNAGQTRKCDRKKNNQFLAFLGYFHLLSAFRNGHFLNRGLYLLVG